MNFNLDDYVDVPERIRQFAEKHPEGSLQSVLTYMENPAGWLCAAKAYRTPDDPRPGVGHAFEPVPGKTPYTKDSEAMNAETSAWGRAIVALGFETKKIASRQEVQARAQDRNWTSSPAPDNPKLAVPASPFQPPKAKESPDDGGAPENVRVHFGKNVGQRLGDLTQRQRDWYANTWEPNPQLANEMDRRLKMAAEILAGKTAA